MLEKKGRKLESSPEAVAPVADVLRAEHLAKRFGPVTALVDVSLHLEQGEILGLIGDNGAGKSTLIKILSGLQRPDSGRLFVDGKQVNLRSVAQARALGIDTVYQDLALVPSLSVYHNMFLTRELVRRRLLGLPSLNNREMKRRTRAYLDELGVGIPSIDQEVARLSGGQRQAIAIARATQSNARILLLDEPLAAMGAKEGQLVFRVIKRLKERGDVSMILIAHNYVHVLEVADRVSLLRAGRIVLDRAVPDTSAEELVELALAEYLAEASPK